MTSFRNQPWSQREGVLGDEAEQQFEQWASESKVGFARYGLNRPPIQVHRLPAMIRYTPDYLMTKRLVEVQGLGRDQRFKIKHEKFDALEAWQDVHPVDLFVWDRTNKRRWMIPLDSLGFAIDSGEFGVSEGVFDGTKPYWSLDADVLDEIGERL